MNVLRSPDINLVPFVSVDNMMRLVPSIGIEQLLKELAIRIEQDFERWELFYKAPRVASHSNVGVIELMPTSDGEMYGFKYVNGHPGNTHSSRASWSNTRVLCHWICWLPLMTRETCSA